MYMSNNLTALAVIPGLLIIIYVYRKDTVEKEPLNLIIRIILFGALSCIAAAYLETFVSQFMPQYPQGSVEYAVTTSFAIAALCEETVKYLAMRFGSWNYSGFNYRFDGVVYGVSSAVGFAIFENVRYVAAYGLETAIVRAFTAVPLHAFCGVFMGVFYAYSKKASILGKTGSSIGYTILALIVPMLIHGTYDTFAFLGQNGIVPLYIFVAILYFAAIKTIKRLSASDYRSGFYPAARPIDYDVEI